MPSLDLMLPLLVASVLLAVTPGPGMLYTTAQTISRGRKSGLYAAVGLHLGSYLHILGAAFGLSLLLVAVPFVYTIVKFVGAGYLVWMGGRYLTTSLSGAVTSGEAGGGDHVKALKESALVEALNPKSALFFIAFLPQFTDVNAAFPIWLQILVLGVIVNVVFSIAEVGYVLLAGRATQFFQNAPTAARWLPRLGGGILVALGIRLATSDLR
ncbi:LysE family translocator [Kiloniella laminariae]|uniref:LysE family translocator n=1 Tax=Kiloniella laminariae TaxID=454162 RepID=A0ABT4LFE2_9PROT|nr:LysE family translocator [Kiloniella laminariae]MCZ4279827.1 LysE family translocator [Kiloniella laminariae]